MNEVIDNRFEANLRITAYRMITDKLVEKGIISKQDERRIRKHISKMQDATIRPTETTPYAHDRDLSTI